MKATVTPLVRDVITDCLHPRLVLVPRCLICQRAGETSADQVLHIKPGLADDKERGVLGRNFVIRLFNKIIINIIFVDQCCLPRLTCKFTMDFPSLHSRVREACLPDLQTWRNSFSEANTKASSVFSIIVLKSKSDFRHSKLISS